MMISAPIARDKKANKEQTYGLIYSYISDTGGIQRIFNAEVFKQKKLYLSILLMRRKYLISGCLMVDLPKEEAIKLAKTILKAFGENG